MNNQAQNNEITPLGIRRSVDIRGNEVVSISGGLPKMYSDGAYARVLKVENTARIGGAGFEDDPLAFIASLNK